jgi:DNA-binding response OmpR family regulator/DNA-binding CsgD family transcriptional regulator
MFSQLISNSRILIVDDNYETLCYLGALLTEHQLKVFSASSGKQAIAIAAAKIPDLILLDVSMPDMSGTDVCKQLKSDAKTKEIPVIFITGKTEIVDIVNGFQAGAIDYITKPFSQEELLARVSAHLKIVKLQEELVKERELLHLKEMELLQKEKNVVEADLERAKKEVVTISLKISKANSQIIEMTDKITSEIKSPHSGTIDRIAEIIHNFNASCENENWSEIETCFVKVHADFFEKLLKYYPDLTKNELKLCAFLRLNLSTKEIAAITLQSEEAIKKSRYRLRQKLNASSDASLCGLILKT